MSHLQFSGLFMFCLCMCSMAKLHTHTTHTHWRSRSLDEIFRGLGMEQDPQIQTDPRSFFEILPTFWDPSWDFPCHLAGISGSIHPQPDLTDWNIISPIYPSVSILHPWFETISPKSIAHIRLGSGSHSPNHSCIHT